MQFQRTLTKANAWQRTCVLGEGRAGREIRHHGRAIRLHKIPALPPFDVCLPKSLTLSWKAPHDVQKLAKSKDALVKKPHGIRGLGLNLSIVTRFVTAGLLLYLSKFHGFRGLCEAAVGLSPSLTAWGPRWAVSERPSNVKPPPLASFLGPKDLVP